MRDTFRKELNKFPKKRSGSEGGSIKESTWPYFKSMEFLKDQFQKRKLEGNVPSYSSQTNEETSDEDVQNGTGTVSPPDPILTENEPTLQRHNLESLQNTTKATSSSQQFVAPEKKRAKMNNPNAVEKLLMIEEKKCKCSRKEIQLL